jgi:hypothetical protein
VVVGLAGLVVGVLGTAYETTRLAGLGLGLLGIGWVLVGLALRGRSRPALAWVTLALGMFALLGAVDRGLVMLPWIPVAPSLPRILLELVWVPWALVTLLRWSSATPAPEPGPAEPVAEPPLVPAA